MKAPKISGYTSKKLVDLLLSNGETTVYDQEQLKTAMESVKDGDRIKIQINQPQMLRITDSKTASITIVGNANTVVSGTSVVFVAHHGSDTLIRKPEIKALGSSFIYSDGYGSIIAKDQSYVYSYMGCRTTIKLEDNAILATTGYGKITATGNSRVIAKLYCRSHIKALNNAKMSEWVQLKPL